MRIVCCTVLAIIFSYGCKPPSVYADAADSEVEDAIRSLEDEHNERLNAYRALAAQVTDIASLEAVVDAHFPRGDIYARRMLAILQRWPASVRCEEAAIWVIQSATGKDGSTEALLDHIAGASWRASAIERILTSLARAQAGFGRSFAERALHDHRDEPRVAAAAKLALARALMVEATDCFRRGAVEQARKLGEEADAFLVGLEGGSDYCQKLAATYTRERAHTLGCLVTDVVGEDEEMRKLDLFSYRGRPVVLFFWTSWCPACAMSLRHVQKMQQAWADRGVTVIGVNGDENGRQALAELARPGPSWRNLMDGESGPVVTAWGLHLWPTLVLVDAEGRIRERCSRWSMLAASLESQLGIQTR
jgi:thiol-disulfide isomerase/thioredoxin